MAWPHPFIISTRLQSEGALLYKTDNKRVQKENEHTTQSVVIITAKELTNREIIDWPHAFIGMLVSLNVDINAILVQQVFNCVCMSQWDPNTDLCTQCSLYMHTHL